MSSKRVSTYAPLPSTVRGQPTHINGDPKGINFLYTNNRSVVIRNIANPELAEEYTEHTCAVSVAKYSPSGCYMYKSTCLFIV
jgi:hypothetical protein